MDEIKGQVIIEVDTPTLCLIDQTKFRIPLHQAEKLILDLQHEIKVRQTPVAESLRGNANTSREIR
jgi:hypothetical protein